MRPTRNAIPARMCMGPGTIPRDVGRLFSEYDKPRPHAVLSVIDQSVSRPRVAALRLVVNAAAVRVVRRERRVDNANAGGGNEKDCLKEERMRVMVHGRWIETY